MGAASPAPRREERLSSLARALRTLADVRDAAELGPVAASAARAVARARGGFLISRGDGAPTSIVVDGDVARLDAAALIATLDGAPRAGLVLGGDDVAALGLAPGTALVAVAVGPGQRWLGAVSAEQGGFTELDRELLVALAAQVAATDEVTTTLRRSRQAEAAHRSSEARLRHIADASVIGLLTASSAGVITEANEALLAMIGYSHDEVAAGQLRWADLSPPEWRDADARFLAELRERGVTAAVEKEYLRKDGARVPVFIGAAGVPGGDETVAFVLDLSERKRLEERLRQSQKMDAIGQLAGGVAHDFNNVLSVILTYGELLVRQLREGDPIRADIEEIVAAGERAKALTRQLLAFSRRQVLQPRVVDLGDVVVGLEPMLRRLLGEDVALDVGRSGDANRARLDPTQIEQVILNLAVNARDAMPEGGHLAIQVDSAILVEPRRQEGVDLAPGDYVRVTVTDTGIGMDDATRARMFEPFFTTKPVGKGTGLGLATVFGIVQQSGGAIAVRSEPGRGTSMAIYLPRTDAPPSTSQRLPAYRLHGDETILLTEDDDALRRLARVALQQHGYRVLEAANGGEALLLCEQHEGVIALLVSDVVLPRMSGRQLAERLVTLRPDMKVLFMTGYTDDAIVRHGVERREVALLQKPFTADELLGRVRRVIDGLP